MVKGRKIHRLPVRLLGLRDIPAIPVDVEESVKTLIKLGQRDVETRQSRQGLTSEVTLDGVTRTAYEWLFEDASAEGARSVASGGRHMEAREAARQELLERLRDGADDVLGVLRERVLERIERHRELGVSAPPSLERADQYSMSWTTFPDIYSDAVKELPLFASTLTDPAAATERFFPTIARYGGPYNLLIARKLDPDDARVSGLQSLLTAAGGADEVGSPEELAAEGRLYVIDMTLFESLEAPQVDGATRFTPSTMTYLSQDPETKALTPFAITVAGHEGADKQHFVRGRATDGAWLYALQAAKASITLYGIWLGHVYHWHIVTAAMQMTMYNNVSAGHPLYELLEPQSNYLFGFDDVLLALWRRIAPPTSVDSGLGFLELANQFADGRNYFDDDPLTTLGNLGIEESDFTVSEPWDRYPIVARLLEMWRATAEYVGVFVETTYDSDRAVADDEALQEWIEDAGKKRGGNVRGLPDVTTKKALAEVLTSLIYRVTVHGTGRLAPSSNPGLTFVANFPPCLQSAEIPSPDTPIGERQLLGYLPNTGTIAEMVTFYFTFAFSVPYVPFVPQTGVDSDLFFPTRDAPDPADPRNQALIAYRERVKGFVESAYGEKPAPIYQWPLNVET